MSLCNTCNTIGLILPNAANQYCVTLIESLSHKFAEKGYTLLVSLSEHDIDRERQLLSFYSECTSGILIISDAADYSSISDVIVDTLPTIFLNRKPNGCTHTCILENNYSAVYQEFFSLKSDGHEKIGCICTQPHFSTSQEIVRAYYDALHLETADPNAYIYYTNGDNSQIPSIVDDLHQKGCRAIFVSSQSLTQHFLDFLMIYNRKLENPKDHLLLAGFANKNTSSTLMKTVDLIHQPIDQTIDLAVQQLLYRIHHPETISRDFILKGTLKKRTLDPFN